MKKSVSVLLLLLFVFAVIICLLGWVFFKPEMQPIDDIMIRFVDVGQGDCEIIQLADGRNIIIDGGKNSTEDQLIEKIRKYGIQRFDYLIATHPHEDHIGGLDKVIYNFDIGCVYMPNAVSNSKTFEELLTAIESRKIPTKKAQAGKVLLDEKYIKLVLVAPNGSNYKDTNNYSAVAKLTYGNRSFLFTGDAESYSEREILSGRANINADVLKVGHHGSSSSTTNKFLKAVKPQYAVIEVGADNSYGHPHLEVLNKLSETETYRTDIHGDITMVCDGVDIKITTEKGTENDTENN